VKHSTCSTGIKDMQPNRHDPTHEGSGRLTSIVILTHNQLECTKKCIESILKYTDDAFELILVDNASTDGTIEYLGLVRSQCSEDALEGDGSNPSCAILGSLWAGGITSS
jgi:hypothetical protein